MGNDKPKRKEASSPSLLETQKNTELDVKTIINKETGTKQKSSSPIRKDNHVMEQKEKLYSVKDRVKKVKSLILEPETKKKTKKKKKLKGEKKKKKKKKK